MVTTGGKVVWSSESLPPTCDLTHPPEYAQITNNPENDGCINSVLLV